MKLRQVYSFVLQVAFGASQLGWLDHRNTEGDIPAVYCYPQSLQPTEDDRIQSFIINMKGAVIGTRMVCKAKPAMVADVRRAMAAMTKDRNNPLYIGEYAVITRSASFSMGRKTEVFYKCPPELVSNRALEFYNISSEEYKWRYHQQTKMVSDAVKSEELVEALMYQAPLGAHTLPLDVMSRNPNILYRMIDSRNQFDDGDKVNDKKL